ncbi:MAG: hypothetical protein ABIQ16_17375 [Polyangiaceae bacterium]
MDRDDIQGLVLHGYRSLPYARYHVLGFGAGEPRQVLARLVTEISSSSEPRASWRLQCALTASGLGALGLSPSTLAQFSREFRQGMAHPERSAALGDVGDEAPDGWEFGGPSTHPLDALCLTYARTREQLDELGGAQERLFGRFGMIVRSYEAEALAATASAPPPLRVPRGQRVPLGEFVLGERDIVGERQRGPFVPVKYGTRPMPAWSRAERAFDFGQNGSYLVLRKLIRETPTEPAANARLVAAHASHALGLASSRAHRLLRRSRRLSDGLWFMALNASIRRQFEFVQQSQCNEPGLGGERDPFIGRRPGRAADESRQFRVRGGAYFFLPGIRALNYLVEPGG